MTRLVEIIRKEFLQLARDRRFLPMILVAPVIQLFFFGYAATSDLKNVRLGVLDRSHTPASRRLVERFEHSGYFEVVLRTDRREELLAGVDRGTVRAALTIPRDYATRLGHSDTAPIQVILDGTDATSATIIQGYMSKIVYQANTEILRDRLARNQIPRAVLEPLRVEERIWYNPELRSVNFMVPGTVCLILLILTTAYTSTAVVRERERGTLDQLIVTPLRKYELLIGKVVPYCLIGMVDVVLIVLVAMYWFHVPMRGSVTLLFGLAAIFLLSTTGTGLFVSATATTQQQSMIVNMFINNIMILLSGFLFPIQNMPPIAQKISAFIPVRYFLVIVRAIFLKGAGADILWPQIWPMACFGVAVMFFSVIRFQKRLG